MCVAVSKIDNDWSKQDFENGRVRSHESPHLPKHQSICITSQNKKQKQKQKQKTTAKTKTTTKTKKGEECYEQCTT